MHTALDGPDAWLGTDIAQSPVWVRDLAPTALAEIDAALRAVQARGLPWQSITRADFPLPSLDALFDDVARELERGCGMVKLRGVPVARYGEDELRQIYVGIATHVGRLLYQNRRGELMRDIRDEGADVGRRYGQVQTGTGGVFLSSYARTLSNGALRFHTDRCDVVALLCVRRSRAGGVSKLASSVAVHNTILARRPDLLEVLFKDYHRSRFGEETGGERVAYALPLFGVRDRKFTSHYSRTYIESAQMIPGVPKLSAEQIEALDLLDAVADELSFGMTLEPGDIQFLNNHVIYHARTPFEDDAAAGQSRLLYRLWLWMPNSRPLPAGHEVLWRRIEPGVPRGGIGQEAAATAGWDGPTAHA
ncbi:MAG TPA: TauD/TfdA family dioxygenase [Candidatus Sulfotelmatobacter sp.]|nr:TauD/TfdA family dioxygenase [Candidatus Sulfotelmatobacter sp.]